MFELQVTLPLLPLLSPSPVQVADPEMLTMMELFSNPDNQALLKAKMEEMKDVSWEVERGRERRGRRGGRLVCGAERGG